MPGADLARGVVGEAPHRADDAVPPEGRAQAIQGRDGQQLGHLTAGELALEPVLLLEHAYRPEARLCMVRQATWAGKWAWAASWVLLL
jgi:hypothetical protein